MYKTLQRTKPWTRTSHVCLSCRRQLLAVRKQQSRIESTSTTSVTETRDDWFGNFNHLLSNASRRYPKRSVPPAKAKRNAARRLGEEAEPQTRRKRLSPDGASKKKCWQVSASPSTAEPSGQRSADASGTETAGCKDKEAPGSFAFSSLKENLNSRIYKAAEPGESAVAEQTALPAEGLSKKSPPAFKRYPNPGRGAKAAAKVKASGRDYSDVSSIVRDEVKSNLQQAPDGPEAPGNASDRLIAEDSGPLRPRSTKSRQGTEQRLKRASGDWEEITALLKGRVEAKRQKQLQRLLHPVKQAPPPEDSRGESTTKQPIRKVRSGDHNSELCCWTGLAKQKAVDEVKVPQGALPDPLETNVPCDAKPVDSVDVPPGAVLATQQAMPPMDAEPVHKVAVPEGLVAEWPDEPQSQIQARVEKPQFTPSKASSVVGDANFFIRPTSLADLVRERNYRGTNMVEAGSEPTKIASYDTLRKADMVSPNFKLRTAVTAKPWGLPSDKGVEGVADAPNELADRDVQADKTPAETSDDTATTRPSVFSRLLGYGLDILKKMWSGRQTRPKAVDSPPGTERRSTPADASVDAHTLNEQQDAAASVEAVQAQDTTASVPTPAQQDEVIDVHQTDAKPQGDEVQPKTRTTCKDLEGAENALGPHRAQESDVQGAYRKVEDRLETNFHPTPFKVRRYIARSLKETPLSSDDADNEDKQSLSGVMGSLDRSDAMSTAQLEPVEDVKSLDLSAADPHTKSAVATIEAKSLAISPLEIQQPPVPGLSYGLDRVLFNSGVYQLQDPHSRVYNFDPYLQKIMPVVEFDFNSLKEYKTSSQDAALAGIAEQTGKKYIGSTSSMTGTLGHFHYLLSDWRDINIEMMSRGFPEQYTIFTNINRAPNAVFLRHKDGHYAIDADKEYDSGNVLMLLGKSMEKLLTMTKSDYERYRKSDPREVTQEERTAPESYEYTTIGDFLMRSQLDAHDPRLPGTGMFDLKTRAVVSVRMDATDYKPMVGYEIHTMQGSYESYEREYYDMLRSTMLKYMLQARMGRMDGIFVAYHNVERIFGFQYLPISEIDRAIHGQVDPCLGDQEFKISLDLLNKVFERATNKFPGKSLRFHFETKADPMTAMYIFAEPMEEDEIELIQRTQKEKIEEWERNMMGHEQSGVEPTPDAKSGEDSSSAEASERPATEIDRMGVEDTLLLPSDEKPPRSNSAISASSDTSDSNADCIWLSSIRRTGTSALKPLFAATLITASRVNGAEVDKRPRHLRPEDEWTVDYILKEIENPQDAWSRYVETKYRRKVAFMKDDDEEVEGEGGEGRMQKEDFYRDTLKKLAKQGREFRRKVDGLERMRVPVVVREPVHAASRSADAADSSQGPASRQGEGQGEVITGVEDYMRWLYRKP